MDCTVISAFKKQMGSLTKGGNTGEDVRKITHHAFSKDLMEKVEENRVC